MIAAIFLSGAALAWASDAASIPAPEVTCRSLAAPGTVAEWRPGDADEPAHCRVRGVLRPVAGSRIGFELLLPPPSRWTGRFQMLGNGGYSSDLPRPGMRRSLARGSAVAATDTGHSGDDPDFARGHPQAIADWAWRAVHVTAIAAKALVARFYQRPADHAYFAGCSTGGHQAMMEAQRFPHDFDGIVAGAPGSNRVRLNAAFLWQYLSNHRRGDDTAALLSPADLRLLNQHAQTMCGSANGGAVGGLASDQWLNDPLSCHVEPAALACRPGQTNDCLAPEQVAAARAMYRGAPDPRGGARVTIPWLPGSEPGWSLYWADPARPQQPARANFWRTWAGFGDGWNWWRFSFGRHLAVAQRRLSPVIDAVNPDLRAFRQRGGKLLQYHGLADPVVSPLDTLAYRRAMMSRTDPRGGGRWYRLFLVPGMGHCGGGPGFTDFDAQAAIETWVERGHAPDRLVAADAVSRTRPLCPFPARAQYVGGDSARAESYRCERPALR